MIACSNCIHNEVCDSEYICDDYFPLHDDIEDLIIEQQIEAARAEYCEAWNLYISDLDY